MKLGQAAKAARGSFGIPPEIHPDTLAQQKAEKEQSATPPPAEDAGFETDDEDNDEDETPAAGEKEKSPLQVLSEMGIKISSDDWSDLFFRGVLEKTIHVADMPQLDGTVKPFNVTVRTLTGDEYDQADELLAEDMQTHQMTRDGLEARKQMWVFSFAIQKVNGRPICKPSVIVDPKTKAETPDPRGTAKAKRKVLSQMSPLVLRMALEKYWLFLGQITALTADPKKNFFGQP